MFSDVPPRSAMTANDVHAAPAIPAPIAAAANGSIADISPTTIAATKVAAMRDGPGAGLMNRSARMLSATVACS